MNVGAAEARQVRGFVSADAPSLPVAQERRRPKKKKKVHFGWETLPWVTFTRCSAWHLEKTCQGDTAEIKRCVLPHPAGQITQPYLVAGQRDVISCNHLSGETRIKKRGLGRPWTSLSNSEDFPASYPDTGVHVATATIRMEAAKAAFPVGRSRELRHRAAPPGLSARLNSARYRPSVHV